VAMNASFENFPAECTAHVFSFLNLHDILRLGLCSVGTLKETLPTIYTRRQQMKQRYAYARNWKNLGIETSKQIGQLDNVKLQCTNTDWIPIPTVEERVDQLFKCLCSSHPQFSHVSELRLDLRVNFEAQLTLVCKQTKKLVFEDIFMLLRRLTRSPRLHSEILVHAIHSNPLDKESEDSNLLSHYIGDVLSVTYLMSQSHLRIVEGGPTNATFLKNLRRLPKGDSCYRSWVYMHSSILLCKSFSDEQRKRLGTPEFSGLSEMIPTDLYINDLFLSSVLTLVFNEFGPLGPAFRGRDLVRHADIPGRALFAFWMGNEQGETATNALEWMMLVHEQSRKARPMTVRAPVVRLCRLVTEHTRPTAVTFPNIVVIA
jgi:hypothetical protein